MNETFLMLSVKVVHQNFNLFVEFLNLDPSLQESLFKVDSPLLSDHQSYRVSLSIFQKRPHHESELVSLAKLFHLQAFVLSLKV